MDRAYELFCLADPDFYESPLRGRKNDPDLAVALRPLPAGWARQEMDDWLVYHPDSAHLPMQGWKIHVSACLDNAEEIAGTVFDYCVDSRVSFKFIRSVQLLLLRNAKYADRGSSGKFATLYPRDERQLHLVLTELDRRLEGKVGPYILSDLRWANGPLYVRYGGFAERYCVGESGEQVLAIEDPSGRLVPDQRGPSFQPPPWVEVPSFLAPHLASRNAASVEQVRYRFEEALHFSNGGGLYAATDVKSGRAVVLKEGRPYAGLALDGSDAVTRLHRERDTLAALSGLGIVPELIDEFVLGDHHFLALERIEGEPLHSAFVSRYPLVGWEPSEEEIRSYTEWALGVHARVEEAVALVHDRGIVIGDLHPNNILVRDDGSVVLLDFEASAPIGTWDRQTMADPGFMCPPGRSGFEVDRYALACLALYLFVPLPSLMRLAPQKLGQLRKVIDERFPVPRAFLTKAVNVISAGRKTAAPQYWDIDPTEDGWLKARASMVDAIYWSADHDRGDRLFPGDIKQFSEGGLNLAHGVAGILYAIAVTGGRSRHDHDEWLAHRALRPEAGDRFGLYDGLLGVAYALDRLNRRDEALKVMEICLTELDGKWSQFGIDLYGGLSGIGLAVMHFAASTGDRLLWDKVFEVASRLSDRLGSESSVSEVSGDGSGFAGLFRGSSGPALLFIRLFEQTGDSAFLDLAQTALSQDLRRCVVRDDGALSVNEGWRTMPYLADGSIGIGMALGEYGIYRDNARFTEAEERIRRAAESEFYIEPGLFYGRSGMITYLTRALPPGTGPADPKVAGHVRRLAWHALSYKRRLAFPGEQLLRLSMDLASGSAGVLLALGAALHDEPVGLPFLEPRSTTPGGPGEKIGSSKERR